MKKITAKFITENLDMLMHGDVITNRGNEYWVANDIIEDGVGGRYDTKNGTIYYLTKDDITMGVINGMVYGKVINGVAYKC